MSISSDGIHKYRWVILFNVVLTIFMANLDSSIVNVALPVMAQELQVSTASIGWVVSSYLIIISSTILIFGRLADIHGKTIVFKFGIALFIIGSFICGISNSLTTLIISRFIQGLGAAASMSTTQAITTSVFPLNERGRALGICGAFAALGAMIGPPLGGFIVSIFSWKFIFLINIPVGLVALILSLCIFPNPTTVKKEKLDLKGSALLVLSITLLFGSLTQGQEFGFNNIFIILGIVISIICMFIFIIIEKNISSPLVDLSIFKNKLFSLSIFCGLISFVCISASNIIQPFYFQNALKFTPSFTGVCMIVAPIILIIISPVSGYLSDKFGSELLTILGLTILGLGLLLMSTLTHYSSLTLVLTFIIIMSLGNGIFQSPNNSLIMSSVPKNKLGIAGSINGLVRNLGLVLGVCLSTTLLYNKMSYKIGYHITTYINGRDDIFIYGMKYVYIIISILCFVGSILTAFRLYFQKNTND